MPADSPRLAHAAQRERASGCRAVSGEGLTGLLQNSCSKNLESPDAKHRILKSVFGFDAFRPGQETVIDALLEGRHVLTVMPTGSGKSLCFQVPALILGGLTIAVSPLIALIQDQVAALRLAGVDAGTINSGQSDEA